MKKKLLCLFSLFTFLGYAQMPVEGFEGSFWPPEGWSVYQNDIGTAIMWEQSQLADPFMSPYEGNFSAVMRRNVNAGGITQDWLVSPVFVPAVGSSIDFFSSQIFAGNQGSTFKLLIIPADDDPSILANYDILQEWTETTAGIEPMTYTQKVVGVPEAFIGTSVRVAFLAEGGQDTWLIDNVNLTGNNCPTPTGFFISGTGLEATLHWNNTGTAWEIEIIPADMPPTGIGEETNQSSYMLTQLVPGMLYRCYVRRRCSDTDYSPWAGPILINLSNSITGVVRYDSDNDGDCDSDDIAVPNVQIDLTIGGETLSAYTNVYGEYAFYNVSYEETEMTLQSYPPVGFAPTTAITVPVDFSLSNNIEINQCLDTPTPVDNLMVAIVPINGARPGFQANYRVLVTNMSSTVVPTANVALTFDDTRLDFLNATGNPVVSGENITFTLADLQPFSTNARNVSFTVAEPPVNIGGEILDFTAVVTPDEDDVAPEDNTAALHQTIVNGFDPNDITCHQGASIYEDETANYLYYTIRFQNTGNGEAVNIRLENTLPDNLDWDTFEPISASHDYTAQRNGDDVKFYFNEIWLPQEDMDELGSHGYVTYRIKPEADVSLGDFMYNEAGIYFDFNPVIDTNTAETEVIERPVSGVADNAMQNITVYPNPVKNVLTIQTANETVSLIEVYDVNGRLCLSQAETAIVNVQSLRAGLYFVKITAGNSITTKKIVKQ